MATSHTFAVTFINAEGQEVLSRFFDTIKAARKWAQWLSAKSGFARNVRIMQGGPGGRQVA